MTIQVFTNVHNKSKIKKQKEKYEKTIIFNSNINYKHKCI